MKLSTKMVLTFSVTTALVIGASVTLLYAKSYRLLINVAEKQATMLTGIVEGQNSGAFNDEDSSGTNPQFQQFLTSLKSSIPALVEMNIYKISLGQVVASTHTDAIGKPVDPEDSAAAQQDTTVVLLERDENNDLVIDVTAPLHGSGTIDYAIGTKFSLADETAFLNTFLVYSIILAVLAIARGDRGGDGPCSSRSATDRPQCPPVRGHVQRRGRPDAATARPPGGRDRHARTELQRVHGKTPRHRD